MVTAALFTTAKTWKQTKCPLTEEWTKKVWYIYHGILLSHEKNETMPSATTRMDLEVTTLSQSEKDKHRMISLTCGI